MKMNSMFEKMKMATYGTFALFLVSCTGSNAPSNKTILEQLNKEPKTEKANLKIVNHAKETFIIFKEFMKNKSNKTLNIELEEAGNSSHPPQYYEFPQEYTVTLVNDSTVTTDIKTTSIYWDSENKEIYSPSSLHSEITFHGNGNIEVNDSDTDFSTKIKQNVTENTNMEIDGESGVIIRYVEITPKTGEVTKYYKLTKDGKIDQSPNYEHGTAMEKINIGNSNLGIFYAINDSLK